MTAPSSRGATRPGEGSANQRCTPRRRERDCFCCSAGRLLRCHVGPRIPNEGAGHEVEAVATVFAAVKQEGSVVTWEEGRRRPQQRQLSSPRPVKLGRLTLLWRRHRFHPVVVVSFRMCRSDIQGAVRFGLEKQQSFASHFHEAHFSFCRKSSNASMLKTSSFCQGEQCGFALSRTHPPLLTSTQDGQHSSRQF